MQIMIYGLRSLVDDGTPVIVSERSKRDVMSNLMKLKARSGYG